MEDGNNHTKPRILLYSHDTYGLGHIRRTLAIAEQLAADFPQATQLLISGTPQPPCFKLPKRLDFIKLPDMDKPSSRKFHAPSLLLPSDALKALRGIMILEAVRCFKPDLVLVDKAPAGIGGEMLPSLNYLKQFRPQTKLVLGMSDIEDHAMMVRENERSEVPSACTGKIIEGGSEKCGQWRSTEVSLLMENDYHLILHYGNRDVYDPVSEYRLSPKIAAKIISCGYIGRTSPIFPKSKLRHSLNMKTNRLVVVTAGGGDDGFELLNFYLKTLSLAQEKTKIPFDSVVIPGPLMSISKRRKLQSYCLMGLPCTILDSTNDMFSYLNAADLVISKGGYNALCEILSLRKRAIIVPHTKPRIEQLIRTGRFAVRGLVEMIHPENLTSPGLLEKIKEGLNGGEVISPEEAGLDMNGALNASMAIEHLLGKKSGVDISIYRKGDEVKKVLLPTVYADTLSAFS